MKSNQIAKTLTIIIAIALTACGTETLPTPIPSPTAEEVSQLSEAESVVTETPTPGPTFTPSPSPEPTATNTLVPTVTATSIPSPTPEPVAKIDETLTGPINVRAGPGTDYPTITQLEAADQELLVTGRNEDSSWWQISLADTESSNTVGWIFAELVILSGSDEGIPIAEIPPLPTATPEAVAAVEAEAEDEIEGETENNNSDNEQPPSAEELADQLRCGKDFCVTYQAMVPIWENGGCVGNHSIYITVLEGPPPGKPMDGVVIGDTFNNVEVGSGSHGPGRTEITLWSNSMTLIAKRHMDGTPYTSEESFNFTSLDELIPAEVLAASGYCESNVEKCRQAQQVNQICRGHYSWRVTFHKLD